MRRGSTVFACTLAAVAALAAAPDVGGQVIQGTVVDANNGRGVALAGVYLLDRDRNAKQVAMADSLGRYYLEVPDSGEYILTATRFGYRDTESPLLAIGTDRTYSLDLELSPQPLGLGGITVTVQNDELINWLKRELGGNPIQAFGFRVLQGERLAEAKAKGRGDVTNTLRWLYIPVSHRGDCVSINSVPRAVRGGYHVTSQSSFGQAGGTPSGTTSLDAAGSSSASSGCGRLLVNDRAVANDFLDRIDMSTIAVVVTFLGEVRMYTFDFDWSFR